MIRTVLAQLCVRDLSVSDPWFEGLFGRSADLRPMPGLVEWRHGDAAGLQVFEAAENAGHGVLTLIVEDLAGERARLVQAGLNPGPIEAATSVDLLRLKDPDGNLIVLAEPRAD